MKNSQNFVKNGKWRHFGAEKRRQNEIFKGWNDSFWILHGILDRLEVLDSSYKLNWIYGD